MSDKTRPGRDARTVSTLAVETYFDEVGLAAGGPLAPQRPAQCVNLQRHIPEGAAPLRLGRKPPTDEVLGHILEDSTSSATITNLPGDPWGFGSVR